MTWIDYVQNLYSQDRELKNDCNSELLLKLLLDYERSVNFNEFISSLIVNQNFPIKSIGTPY